MRDWQERPIYYKLDGHTPVPVDHSQWPLIGHEDVKAMAESVGARVASSVIGDVEISTVFTGLDMQHFDGPPLLFETMAFPSNEVWRYSTWEQAETGHAEIVGKLKGGGDEDRDD
jgi:hypothetical protein